MKTLTARIRSCSSLAVAAVAVCGGVGCDQGSRHLLAAPSVVASPALPASPAVPATPAGPSLAVLEFVTLTTHPVLPAPRQAAWELKLAIAETGGRSGAHFSTVEVTWPGNTDFGCAVSSRVSAGGTWDMEALGYCAPGPFSTPTPTVTVRFTDDEGRAGILTGVASLAGAASLRASQP